MNHKIIRFFLISIVGFISLTVMVGWVLGIGSMTRIIPFGWNMKFFTAFMFFLSAIGLNYIYHIVKSDSEIAEVILPGVSMTICLILVSIIVSRLFLTPSLSIEELFVRTTASPNMLGSGSVPLPTLAGFFLFSVACIAALFPYSRRLKIIEYAGLSMIIFPLFIITGNIFYIPLLVFFKEATGMTSLSFITGFSFVALGLSLVIISKVKNKPDED